MTFYSYMGPSTRIRKMCDELWEEKKREHYVWTNMLFLGWFIKVLSAGVLNTSE